MIETWKNDFMEFVNSLNLSRDDYKAMMEYIDEILLYSLTMLLTSAKKVEGDCISRQVAIKALHDEIVRKRIGEDDNDGGALDEFDTEAILRRLPSAQPEMIRCKECKFSHMTNDGRYCKYCDQFTDTDDYGELVEMYFDSDFYCGYAERRTDERFNR